MPGKKPQRKRPDAGTIIDTVKTLVIEGISLYKQIKPLVKKSKTRKGKKKHDIDNIQNP